MPGEDLILSESNRAKLDGIVSKAVANNESDENIQFIVNDFKQKYGEKKNPVSLLNSPLQSTADSVNTASSLVSGSSAPSGNIDFMGGGNFDEVTEVPTIKAEPQPVNEAEYHYLLPLHLHEQY